MRTLKKTDLLSISGAGLIKINMLSTESGSLFIPHGTDFECDIPMFGTTILFNAHGKIKASLGSIDLGRNGSMNYQGTKITGQTTKAGYIYTFTN